ncbi:GNAT family N-acetyltransferase [Paenibacillus sp. GP183]|uniref:GNAT family N-acetyltransferase n=1 Tax=Paenibacillus sp. GP183 TaxID=1882751 RepID=UPI00149561F4|nr:GNAT family N-acetyltransferase [Paenibacillus sp. GP183]
MEKDFIEVNHNERQKAGLELILNHPESGQLLVLLNHEYVIGMANMLFTISTAEGGRAIILEDYILSESERGKGNGSFFMQEIIKFARNKGILRISLLVDADNGAAQKFYEGAGYQFSNMKCMRLNLS